MFRIAILRVITLEFLDHGAADKSCSFECSSENSKKLRLELPMRAYQIHQRNVLCHRAISASGVITRTILAGLPATIAFGGTSCVTTLPAPTIAPSPIVTFERIVAPEPMDAPFFTSVCSTYQSFSVCN